MGLIGFPSVVDEVAARLVAGAVAVLAAAALALDLGWVLPVLAYGFVARVLAGPRLSPLALLVTRVVLPRLPVAERPVPGPPKRFAQGMGAAFTLGATALWLAGAQSGAWVLIALLIVAATLEAVLGLCLGCRIFAALMRLGVVPPSVCERCAPVSGRARP